ncbi:MAG: nucleoside deaminase, partial [Balneolaceae bacterium]
MFNGKESPHLNFHSEFMHEALQLAKKAADEKEIPVGAVVVRNLRIIGKGYNQTEKLNDPTAHAEMIAISSACATAESKYLHNCAIYVTLEPCPMCAGAI